MIEGQFNPELTPFAYFAGGTDLSAMLLDDIITIGQAYMKFDLGILGTKSDFKKIL